VTFGRERHLTMDFARKSAVDQWGETMKQSQWSLSGLYPQAIDAQDGSPQAAGSQSSSFRQRSWGVWQKYPNSAEPMIELSIPSRLGEQKPRGPQSESIRQFLRATQ